jgi:hypothetical protein
MLCCANAASPCYASSGEKGTGSEAWKTGQDIK